MLSSPNKRYYPQSHKLRTTILVLLWLLILGVVALNRQNILDWWKLRSYDAPVNISALATQDTMTDYATKVFYVNEPLLQDKTPFFKKCPSGGREQTIVLGCYHGNQAGIYLLDVKDVRLEGVEQVTAAHEMLHAAYDRLSSSDRANVDKMLQDFYDTGLTDQRVRDTVAAYKKTEPNDLVNEMHSIFGTEVSKLPAPLEEYYKRYFSDRGKVIGFAERYQSEFTSRDAIRKQTDDELATLKPQIQSLQDGLKEKRATIDQMQKQLLAYRNSNNINAYNSGVPGYNSLIDSYNSDVERLKSLIITYNDLVAKRNAVALEEDQLFKDLSSDQVETIN